MKIQRTCIACKKLHELNVPDEAYEAYEAWRNGALIQSVMSELTPDERELLISGICGKCFDKMFAE